MNSHLQIVAEAIDRSPYNHGISGDDWLASDRNTPVVFENGDVALFENEGDGTFEAHFLFVSRGRQAIEHVRAAFQTMFEKNGAKVIFGLIPKANRKMKLVARWAGAKSRGERWIPDDNGGEFCELFTITRGFK
jgi:hypothetical protein